MSLLPTWVPDLRLHCCVTHTDWARNATQTALSWSRKCPWMKPNTRLDFATAGAPSRTHSNWPTLRAWRCPWGLAVRLLVVARLSAGKSGGKGMSRSGKREWGEREGGDFQASVVLGLRLPLPPGPQPVSDGQPKLSHTLLPLLHLSLFLKIISLEL